MSSWYGILEVCSDFIEAWLCYHFVGIFLPDRVRGRLPFFILSAILVFSVRVMNIQQIDPLISTLWFVFFICMTTVVLFQVDLFYAVSLVSFYILCVYVINFFCMSVIGVMVGNRQFASFVLSQLSLLRCAYLAADKVMLLEGRTGDAVTYLSHLQEPLEHLSPSIWTGTPTLDILLNHARNRCALADVRFTIQADALNLSAMEDQDICSLFSNLLDNACEAAAQMPQEQRWILVKLRRIKEMVFIDISNSACQAPLKRGGRLVSQKQESRLHGIGLNSASMTAAKYAGTLEYTYEDNVFSVKVSFLSGIIGILVGKKRGRG